ncbi:membrane protein TerC, possibly involved in tellurium resistance [Anopheles sinensis]|uniref:Membrane protein TerC, possibly involved in tellurium resistance n=1 Tax=Anopheles sinensis TaxID=74873 RepID=A0A084WGS7_ANOSI|nr:membrane protein TerC, possibly involved in tellurium resistance [Anopheles sinensis]
MKEVEMEFPLEHAPPFENLDPGERACLEPMLGSRLEFFSEENLPSGDFIRFPRLRDRGYFAADHPSIGVDRF